MVSPYDRDVLLTREIQVLRIINSDNKYGIDPYYLLYLLSHDITQRQLPEKIMIDTTLPNIARRWEDLYLPIAKDKKVREAISRRVKGVIQNRWKSQAGISELMDDFGQLTT
jgi:type I restriction enzyme M protein